MTFGPRTPESDARSALPHAVYVLLDVNDNPLYIGCSHKIGQRLAVWQSSADWWAEVARIDVTFYPNQRAALDVERDLIEQHNPPHNVVHTPRFDAGGWATRRAREARVAAGLDYYEFDDEAAS